MNTLPTAPEAAASPATRGEELPNAAPSSQLAAIEPRARILYVDAEPQLTQLSQSVLIQSGYVVDTAADGIQAWKVLQHAPYNLLITDNAIPRLTGLELASNARLAGMRLPIMMTSNSTDPLRDPAWTWLNIAAFLSKPFAFDALVETVEQVLHSANDPHRSGDVSGSEFKRLGFLIQPWRHGGINE